MTTAATAQVLAQQIDARLAQSYWPGYVHGYPHKKAYRPLTVSQLAAAWPSDTTAVNVYLHVPFCVRRCAFCNLFSIAISEAHQADYIRAYVHAMERQVRHYRDKVPGAQVQSLYWGGGTPNILPAQNIAGIMNVLRSEFTRWASAVETSMECSPDLLTKDYVDAIADAGISRVSLGVQSLDPHELRAIKRDDDRAHIDDAYRWLREAGMSTNLDLIYGLPGQSEKSWMRTVSQVIAMAPENITVYPLAVRKFTAVADVDASLLASMAVKYRMWDLADGLLEAAGYRCETVVRYRRSETSTYQQQNLEFAGVPTIGLGAGARSYAPNTHYCMPYRVQPQHARPLVAQYMACTDFAELSYDGFEFNLDERKRRFVMLRLLGPKLAASQYAALFGESLETQFGAELEALMLTGLVAHNSVECSYTLTRRGRKYSDIATSLFVSSKVRELEETYPLM